ncbi:MAG: ABC transporter substrate-binding protein [Planctomycetia bacterium]|nr:ABC transporter substrate-binding protein [Planctomycetia bacterium]
MFHSQPSVSFLGNFAAKELGIFKKLGLPPIKYYWENDSSQKIEFLMQGNLDIINCWMAEGIQARSNGVPIVALALLPQKSSSCFMVRRDLDPTLIDLRSLQGRNVPIWAHYELTPLAFLATQKIKINPVVQRAETNMLFNEGVVKSCFTTTYTHAFFCNYLEFRKDVQVFRFSDYGVDFPEQTCFCRESFMRNHPELCRKYILGVYMGWKEVVSNPDRGVEILSKYCEDAGILSNRFLLKKQLEIWLSLLDFKEDLSKNGSCTPERYQKLADALVLSGAIEEKKKPEFKDFFFPIMEDHVYNKLQQAKKPANSK